MRFRRGIQLRRRRGGVDGHAPERRHHRRARRLNGRRQAEQHAAHHRESERDEQHAPVQIGVEGKGLVPVGEQQRQQAHACEGDHHAECGGNRRQHHAFRQQLADQAEPSGTDAEPHRNLPAPCRCPRQQQVRGVRARDRQDQADDGQQQVDRLRVLSPQAVEAARAFVNPQDRKIGALTVVAGGWRHPLREWRRERRFGLRERHPGAQPPHDAGPVEVRIREHARGVRVEEDLRAHWQIHLWRRARIDAEEF